MKDIFKSEFIYLLTNEKVSDKKLLLADFNFTEVSVCFSIELVSGKIIGLPKPTFDYNGNANIETNSKEIISRCYKNASENIGKEISTDDLLSFEDKIKPITNKDFKDILLENSLFSKFLEYVYSLDYRNLTDHINLIFNL